MTYNRTEVSGADASTRRGDARLGAARIFNSTVAGFAIAAAWEIGALSVLHADRRLNIYDFCTANDLDRVSTDGMFSALASVDIVKRDGENLLAGPEFDEVFQSKAFFHWLTIGCADLFANMPSIIRNENRTGNFYRRNAVAISYACRDINAQAFDPAFRAALDSIDFKVTKVADLGCGGGSRLVQLADRYPGTLGVGVDISDASLADAEQFVASAGYGAQFDFIRSDVRAVGEDPRFEDVDLLTCFMMGHDLWPREDCVASLRKLRAAFPGVRRFLLGDTARTDGVADRDKRIFTLGFETAHDLMGVFLPTLSDWESVFDDSGWTCLNVRAVDTPADSVIYELA